MLNLWLREWIEYKVNFTQLCFYLSFLFLFFISFIETRSDFELRMSHYDMNGDAQITYKMGDFIMFSMLVNSTAKVKGAIQKCWATPDGTNKYHLIDNQ